MLKKDLKQEIAARLEELEGVETSEAMYEMFNTDYYIIGTYQATEFLGENIHDVFEVLEKYNDEFGEQYADITDPEKLASLVALMTAQEIWGELETVSDLWDATLEKEHLEKIEAELLG